MTAKVILNPYSNRWNSQKRWPEVESALKAAGVDFDLVISQKKGQITELAEQAVYEKCSSLIVAGGDGSIGDAANGLMRAVQSKKGRLVPLGIMPTGSANDLIFALGLPTDLKEAAKVIAAGKTRAMDLGKLNDRYFVNNSAAGKLSFLSIGNGRRTGGFFMTPHADPFDGKLTLAFGYRTTRLGLFQALPRAFNEDKGSYVEMEGMQEVHATRISVHLDKPSPAHTDGELFPDWMQDFEYEILPKYLNIIVP